MKTKQEKVLEFDAFYGGEEYEREIIKYRDIPTDDMMLEEIDFSDVDDTEIFDTSFIPKKNDNIVKVIEEETNDNFWGLEEKDTTPKTKIEKIVRKDKKELIYFYSYNTREIEIEESNIDKTNGYYTLLKEEIKIRYNIWAYTKMPDSFTDIHLTRLINNFIYFNGKEKIEDNIHLFFILMLKAYTNTNFSEAQVKIKIKECLEKYDESTVDFMVDTTNTIFNHKYSIKNDEGYKKVLSKVKRNTSEYISEFKKTKKEEVMRLKTEDLGDNLKDRFWELVEDYSIKKQDVIKVLEKEFDIQRKTIYKYSPTIKGVDIIANRIIDYTDKNYTKNMKEVYTSIGVSEYTFYEKIKKYGKEELGLD